ncbi:hypothetical protein [Cellulomonas triticagri]|uniref:Uncharacterized protein n=1 Tax=Cellulomonas triticagri TaxID=2483352 RepID=A0A3M2J3V6_9CELL|nr:hypothetical protein [Cellulomonas triticagri]RMI06580.1 hypothetical protein EBM89_15990 [Cellulomonas triticagri]
MTTTKRVLRGALAAMLVLPMSTVVVAGPAQAKACYSTKTSTSLVSADASVSYGSCRSGTTRSFAQVGIAKGDSGWHPASTWASARGVGGVTALAQVSAGIK